MNVVAFVFARGGSKGVPGKNLRVVGGLPLVGHAVTAARRARYVRTVVVSTDDPAIADAARAHGAEVPFLRPAHLATDDAAEWRAWQHALTAWSAGPGRVPVDVFLSVPPTSPLRLPADLDACVDTLLSTGADATVTVTRAARNPWFNIVRLGPAGEVRPVLTPPGGPVTRRQDAPAAYDLTTVAYAARPDYVLGASGLFEGRVTASVVPPERALDIDTEVELAVAEALLERRAARAA